LQRASDQRVGSLAMTRSLAVETLAVETLVEMIADHREISLLVIASLRLSRTRQRASRTAVGNTSVHHVSAIERAMVDLLLQTSF